MKLSGADLVKENKDLRGLVMPSFHSRAGEVLTVPVEFEAVIEPFLAQRTASHVALALPSALAKTMRTGSGRKLLRCMCDTRRDIELEIAFRIAIRGRATISAVVGRVNKAQAVVIWLVDERAASEEQGQKGVTSTAEVFRMRSRDRALIFGVHSVLIHPFFVAWAWWRLLRFPRIPGFGLLLRT